jgi:hypothetical protein
MGKFFLNLILGEPLSPLKKMSCFDNLIELYVLLEGTLFLGSMIWLNIAYSMQSRLSFVGAKCSATSKCPIKVENVIEVSPY